MSVAAQGSAVAALRLGLSVLLRLFAPVLPFVSEEIWSWSFADETGAPSIHRAAWPSPADFKCIAKPDSALSFELAVAARAAINQTKSKASVSMGRPVARLRIRAHPETLAGLEPVLADVLAAARCAGFAAEATPSLAPGALEVAELIVADVSDS